MAIFSANLAIVLFIFPGIFFSAISIVIWMFLSHFIFQKIDKNYDLKFIDIYKNVASNFTELNLTRKFSKGVIFLYMKLFILFILQCYIFIEFFSSKGNSGFSLVFILLLGLIFEFLYQLELNSGILIFIGKIFSEFIIILGFGLLLFTQNSDSFLDLSFNITKNADYLELVLLILIIFSISKTSTYMDYKKVISFNQTPNDLLIYKSKIEYGNPVENLVRWISESYLQIVFVQLIVLVLFPLLSIELQLSGPLWIQPFLFIVFQFFILILAVFLNLLSSSLEFKVPNQQTKGIIFVLVFLSIIVFTS